MSDPGAHHPPAIVGENVVGVISARAAQSRAAKHAQKRSYTRLAAFSSRGAAAQLLEPRERGVQVGLVEELAAVDQVAVDRQNVDPAPLGVEALVRCHAPYG